MGEPLAKALDFRVQCMRRSLCAHWRLSAMLGAHYRLAGDAIAASKLVGACPGPEVTSDLSLGNWARHAAPPGCARAPAPPDGLPIAALESFRAALWQGPAQDHCEHVGKAASFLAGAVEAPAAGVAALEEGAVYTLGVQTCRSPGLREGEPTVDGAGGAGGGSPHQPWPPLLLLTGSAACLAARPLHRPAAHLAATALTRLSARLAVKTR